MKNDILNQILVLPKGESIDWKFGLITRDVLRIDEESFLISETSGTWIEAKVTTKTLIGLFDGSVELLELNWQ